MLVCEWGLQPDANDVWGRRKVWEPLDQDTQTFKYNSPRIPEFKFGPNQ